jgi:hypothetical protein
LNRDSIFFSSPPTPPGPKQNENREFVQDFQSFLARIQF